MVLQCTAGVSPEKIDALVEGIKSLPQVEADQFHHFDAGVYQRGLVLKAGLVAAGAVHLRRNLLTLVKGECLFLGDDEPVHAVAPWSTISGPGTQRAVYAITDCVLISYVDTALTDPDEVMQAVTVPTLAAYRALLEPPK